MTSTYATPVTVIGGYLGSGKTTLVNHLLRNAGRRKLAVLVNDFGALPIDADLIETERDDIISIAGGCVCCSYGNDLLAALDELSRNRPEITDVLVESSGVALPSSIASSISLLQRYRVNTVVTLCDLTNILELCADRFLSDTMIAQIEGADLILLNKADLVGTSRKDQVASWLTCMTRTAHILQTSESRVPAQSILDRDRGTACLPGPAHDPSIYRTTHVLIPNQVWARNLAEALTHPELGLLRAKGVLLDKRGDIVQLHVVGSRWSLKPFPNSAAFLGHLVTIGLRSGADQVRIEHLVRQHVAPPN